jgi:FAD/FMN-containing dehydrogenase
VTITYRTDATAPKLVLTAREADEVAAAMRTAVELLTVEIGTGTNDRRPHE